MYSQQLLTGQTFLRVIAASAALLASSFTHAQPSPPLPERSLLSAALPVQSLNLLSTSLLPDDDYDENSDEFDRFKPLGDRQPIIHGWTPKGTFGWPVADRICVAKAGGWYQRYWSAVESHRKYKAEAEAQLKVLLPLEAAARNATKLANDSKVLAATPADGNSMSAAQLAAINAARKHLSAREARAEAARDAASYAQERLRRITWEMKRAEKMATHFWRLTLEVLIKCYCETVKFTGSAPTQAIDSLTPNVLDPNFAGRIVSKNEAVKKMKKCASSNAAYGFGEEEGYDDDTWFCADDGQNPAGGDIAMPGERLYADIDGDGYAEAVRLNAHGDAVETIDVASGALLAVTLLNGTSETNDLPAIALRDVDGNCALDLVVIHPLGDEFDTPQDYEFALPAQVFSGLPGATFDAKPSHIDALSLELSLQ